MCIQKGNAFRKRRNVEKYAGEGQERYRINSGKFYLVQKIKYVSVAEFTERIFSRDIRTWGLGKMKRENKFSEEHKIRTAQVLLC